MSVVAQILTTVEPTQRKALWQSLLSSFEPGGAVDPASAYEAVSSRSCVELAALAVREGWLEGAVTPALAAATSDLAAALPASPEREELERRIERWWRQGTAEVFAVVAARRIQSGEMDVSADRGVRARLSLCLSIPWTLGRVVEDLAVAVISRPSAARCWLEEQSIQSLPERRAAARLLEQGARAVVRRAPKGGGWSRRLLDSDAYQVALGRLLLDREPLVWRHAAIARGLLAPLEPALQQAITAGLEATGPTDARRAATSLVASLWSAPSRVLGQLRSLLEQGFCQREPGLVGALVAGLGPAAAYQPDAADELLGWLLSLAPTETAEALPEQIELGYVPRPARTKQAIEVLQRPEPTSGPGRVDDGRVALRRLRLGELLGGSEDEAQRTIERALRAYVEQGAVDAARLALEALENVEASVATLALLDEVEREDSEATEVRQRLFTVLDNTQRSVLRDDTLDALLLLGDSGRGDGLNELSGARDWIASWVLHRWTARPPRPNAPLFHHTFHIHQLRTLLYAADAHTQTSAPASLEGARQRRQQIASAMLEQLRAGVPRSLERAVCATLARALDTLLRGGHLDAADVLLLVARSGLSASALRVLIEASSSPALDLLLEAYLLTFRDLLEGPFTSRAQSVPPTLRAPPLGAPSTERPGSVSEAPASLSSYGLFGERIRRLRDFVPRIDGGTSSRAGELRDSLRKFTLALEQMLAASSLEELGPTADRGNGTLQRFDEGWQELLLLAESAAQRLRLRLPSSPPPRALAPALSLAVKHRDPDGVARALAQAQADLERTLPEVLSSIASPLLGSLLALPLPAPAPRAPRRPALPAWLPDSRILGGFHLLGPIGSGGAGSVFIARRVEDANRPDAERFALKVPDYDGTAARTLSEEQFLQLFRDEASALLNLPLHPNLSRFVTFDLAARPKPILVMELVEGQTLDLFAAQHRDRALLHSVLDGLLAGLEAMHRTGIGHHDLKPHNVILRGGREPVLVDFGLAGRTLRPGCGSLSYGAPEIWLGASEGFSQSPLAADVYAAACLAFELLTGAPLFSPDSEMAAISAHIAHDGWPSGLSQRRAELGPLAELLHDALRRDPAVRIGVTSFRQRLRALR